MKASRRLLAAFTLLLLGSGCATEPGEITGIGALTGGAVGAGLGAIIGSQTGDAGAGIAVGAAAGSLAGAMIGNELQAQEEELELQDERVRRQELRIDTQRRQIDSLRDLDPDGALVASAEPSTQVSAHRLFAGRTAGASESDPARNPSLARASDTEESESSRYELPRARYGGTFSEFTQKSAGAPALPKAERVKIDEHAPAPTKESAGATQKSKAPVTSTRKTRARTTSQESAKRETSPAAIVPELPSVEQRPSERDLIETPSPEDLVDPEAREVAALTGDLPVEDLSTECEHARKEESKAKAAKELPDTLFHLRRALRLCPSDPSFHVSMGEAYLRANRKEDANYEFREALKLDPGYGPALERLSAEFSF